MNNINKKIIILEGLPGVGKTTITKYIQKHYPNVKIVNELLLDKMPDYVSCDQDWFMKNDDVKMNSITDDMVIVDRGPISTLSYNQTRNITDENYDFNLNLILTWFNKYKSFLRKSNVYVIYLTNNGSKYSLTLPFKNDPYGSEINQKLLETITIYNCKKYSNNFRQISYFQNNMEELINEIIN